MYNKYPSMLWRYTETFIYIYISHGKAEKKEYLLQEEYHRYLLESLM